MLCVVNSTISCHRLCHLLSRSFHIPLLETPPENDSTVTLFFNDQPLMSRAVSLGYDTYKVVFEELKACTPIGHSVILSRGASRINPDDLIEHPSRLDVSFIPKRYTITVFSWDRIVLLVVPVDLEDPYEVVYSAVEDKLGRCDVQLRQAGQIIPKHWLIKDYSYCAGPDLIPRHCDEVTLCYRPDEPVQFTLLFVPKDFSSITPLHGSILGFHRLCFEDCSLPEALKDKFLPDLFRWLEHSSDREWAPLQLRTVRDSRCNSAILVNNRNSSMNSLMRQSTKKTTEILNAENLFALLEVAYSSLKDSKAIVPVYFPLNKSNKNTMAKFSLKTAFIQDKPYPVFSKDGVDKTKDEAVFDLNEIMQIYLPPSECNFDFISEESTWILVLLRVK